jgi:adenosylcobinamide-GDP ribazoletransferase
VQFLTRLPLPQLAHDPEALSRSAMYFPLAGLAIGAVAAILYTRLLAHSSALIAALFTVLFTVVITGALHEDGFADAVDAFGGGSSREQVLTILKDSRIGAYGALAVTFSVAGRILLIGTLPRTQAADYLIAAHVLARWTILPLGYFLPAARSEASQGARLARQTSAGSMFIGTAFTAAIVGFVLRTAAPVPIFVALVIMALTGVYYRRRLGGITGDCFGATLQITEIAVYCAGVWRR